MKATSFMKSRKFLGMYVSLYFLHFVKILTNILYSPGFFSRLKEKGTLAKDVWGVIGSALSVRDLMLVSIFTTSVDIYSHNNIIVGNGESASQGGSQRRRAEGSGDGCHG